MSSTRPTDVDTRVCHGWSCSWVGSIYDVGRTRDREHGIIPGCPHCGSTLAEFPDPLAFWSAVRAVARDRGGEHYVEFVHWLWDESARRCWPTEFDPGAPPVMVPGAGTRPAVKRTGVDRAYAAWLAETNRQPHEGWAEG